MDLYYNIRGEKVKAIQWDGSKEHGAEIAKEIDMDVRYDLTDGVLTMHIGGYDATVAKQFDFVYLNTTGVDVASYQTFINEHVRATHQQVVTKSLHNTTASKAKDNVKDIVFWGDGDTFKLICKASSESEGWMKSTKAMQAAKSVVVQVTTQQRNPDGSYSLAEALTTVACAYIHEEMDENGNVIKRKIRSI